jgi:hypothetical protein
MKEKAGRRAGVRPDQRNPKTCGKPFRQRLESGSRVGWVRDAVICKLAKLISGFGKIDQAG